MSSLTKTKTHSPLLDLDAIGKKPTGQVATAVVPSMGPWKVLLLFGSGIFALAGCYQVLATPQPHSDWGIDVTIASLVFLSGFFIASCLIFRSPYLFTSAYMVALSLFHLGVTIPDALGFMTMEAWHSGSQIKWLEQAGWYTVLALSSMGIGFGLSLTPERLEILHRPVEPPQIARSLAVAYRDGMGLLLVSCVMFGFAIASFGNLLTYSRVDFFRGVGDTRGLGVFLMVFPSALTLLVIGAQDTSAATICVGTSAVRNRVDHAFRVSHLGDVPFAHRRGGVGKSGAENSDSIRDCRRDGNHRGYFSRRHSPHL